MTTDNAPTTPLPPVPSGQGSWPDEAKVFFLNLRARGTGLDSAYAQMLKTFDLAGKIPKKRSGGVPLWERREAAGYLAALRADLKADYSKLKFSQKWERISIVGQLVLSLLSHFELEDQKGKEAQYTALTKLSAEIRQGISEIHSQLEGAGLDDARIVSIAEKIEERRREIAARSSRAEDILAKAAN